MKKIVVLGAGESGTGAAILAKCKGMDVFVSDIGDITPMYQALLDQHHIAWESGQHTPHLIMDADEVIKSPGIPLTTPLIRQLIEQGTPILSEIEFAARYTNAKMICITGSNGKTTTTSLIFDVLLRAGLDVGLAGNIGNSLALQVAQEDHAYYVIELSSFQLDNCYDFKADIAILLNITQTIWTVTNISFKIMWMQNSVLHVTRQAKMYLSTGVKIQSSIARLLACSLKQPFIPSAAVSKIWHTPMAAIL